MYSLMLAGAWTSLTILLAHQTAASTFGNPMYSNNFRIPGVNASYDYVIVGGGTPGLALAYRPSQNQNLTVAVIEAGGFYEQETETSLSSPATTSKTQPVPSPTGISRRYRNLNYPTPPAISYARGKTLGGSSALNALAYQIGTTGSYQAWADAVGDQSYKFSNFHPFFQMSANYTSPNTSTRAANDSVPAPPNGTYLQTRGPLHVSFPNTAAPFSSWGQLGLRAIGIQDINDFSSGALLGRQYCPITLRLDDQTRSTSESSFL